MTDNTFKQNTFVLKEDGKIVWIEKMPEIPSLLDCQNIHFGKPNSDSGRMLQKLAYKQALQSAIANGIEVENHKEVIAALKYHHLDKSRKPLEEGKLYPLQCRVEVKETWWSKPSSFENKIKVARVTFDEQPEKRHAESERLFDKFLAETSDEELNELLSSIEDEEPEAAGQEQEAMNDKLWWEFLYDVGSKRHYLNGETCPDEPEKMRQFLESKYTITITRKKP